MEQVFANYEAQVVDLRAGFQDSHNTLLLTLEQNTTNCRLAFEKLTLYAENQSKAQFSRWQEVINGAIATSENLKFALVKVESDTGKFQAKINSELVEIKNTAEWNRRDHEAQLRDNQKQADHVQQTYETRLRKLDEIFRAFRAG